MSTILGQRNHLWADKHLGLSHLTIHDYGCTTCCLAMINNKFGASCTPDQVAAHTDWYTLAGLVLWNKLQLKNAKFDWRQYGVDLQRIREYLADPNKAVMLEVRMPKGGSHWMVADMELLNTPRNDDFLCDDPWSGVQLKSDHYGPVIGSAFFSKRNPALL